MIFGLIKDDLAGSGFAPSSKGQRQDKDAKIEDAMVGGIIGLIERRLRRSG